MSYHDSYVQKHIIHLAALFGFPAGSRLAARGVRICEKGLFGLYYGSSFVSLSKFDQVSSSNMRNVPYSYFLARCICRIAVPWLLWTSGTAIPAASVVQPAFG